MTQLVQDTTELDFIRHPATKGLGLIGNHRGRGKFLQTVLAIDPRNRDVLGHCYQDPFIRTPIPAGETRTERRKRVKQRTSGSTVSRRSEVLKPPAGGCISETRVSEMFEFMHTCRSN